MNFTDLIHIINETDVYLKQKAYVAVNQSLTFKNWLTGFYIVEFEQNGEDRAKYGEKLLPTIAKECKSRGLKGYSYSNLKYFRQFYQVYPYIGKLAIEYLTETTEIRQTLSGEFENTDNQSNRIRQTPIGESNINFQTQDFNLPENHIGVAPENLVKKLSYSHFIELIQLNDPYINPASVLNAGRVKKRLLTPNN